jgi:hypothetical protein
MLGFRALNRSSLLSQIARWIPRLAAGCCLIWAPTVLALSLATEGVYTVKRGDTVFTIARSYGIPAAVLAERNGLNRNYHLHLGQRLIIPRHLASRPAAAQSKKSSAAANGSRLPPSIQSAIDRAAVRSGRWQYIVVHHSGVDAGTVKAMDHYHREVRHMEHGLAYDFVIGNGNGMGDGEIAVGPRWTQQLDGGHLASEAQNKIAIGICLVGNFDEHKPNPKQMDSLRALVQALLARCHLTPDAVKSHQQINIIHTRCPGTKFPISSLLATLTPAAGHK